MKEILIITVVCLLAAVGANVIAITEHVEHELRQQKIQKDRAEWIEFARRVGEERGQDTSWLDGV